MVAMARNLTMSSKPVRSGRIRPEWFDEIDYAVERSGQVRCLLHLGRTVIGIDVPADAVLDYRVRPHHGIYFEVPGELGEPVQESVGLSKAEHDWADSMIREMESFDGF